MKKKDSTQTGLTQAAKPSRRAHVPNVHRLDLDLQVNASPGAVASIRAVARSFPWAWSKYPSITTLDAPWPALSRDR